MTAALVTGGSAGIGRAICEHLLAKDYDVISLDRQAPRFAHARLRHIGVDLTNAAAMRAAAAQAMAGGPITTLVHNAGAMRPALLADVRAEDLEALVALHLTAALTLVQAALPAMQAQHFGRIVMISSRAALGLATRTAYSATKAGMIGMARTWALELAPHGITVNTIAPGPVETDIFHEVLPPGDPRIDRVRASIPMQRLGQPDDVARAVLFFTDPANSFVTGQTLFVCGGTSIGSLTI
jgi:NAD(P)-dependent dehydrogenase (short-subunit alcohol dehydrogenase family)